MTEEQALEHIKEAVGLYLPGNSEEYVLNSIRGVLAEVEQDAYARGYHDGRHDAYARGYRDGLHDAEQGNAGEF